MNAHTSNGLSVVNKSNMPPKAVAQPGFFHGRRRGQKAIILLKWEQLN